jgi:hypothetical protein
MRSMTIALTTALALVAVADLHGQIPLPLTDKIADLRGTWKVDSARRMGGICGVGEEDSLAFTVTTASRVHLRTRRFDVDIPLDGSETDAGGSILVASIDAGWLKLTLTNRRNGGYANVFQDVFILNRARTELTLWRTLNVRTPDGSSGKIDCGNRVALVFVRQPE